MEIVPADIRAALRDWQLSGRALCVHSSLRSFGWVQGGARAIVDAFLAEDCTLLVPAFASCFEIPPPDDPAFRPARNGWDYATSPPPNAGAGRVYTPAAMEINRDMGRIPAAVLARPDRARGNHPLCSFAVVGPLAQRLVAGQSPLAVFPPLEALAGLGGSVLLMGVGLERMTLLHLAEQRAGREPFRRWANGPDGRPLLCAVGGCSEGFGALWPALGPGVRERRVGRSLWRLFAAEEALAVAAAAIRARPEVTACGEPTCAYCADAVLGGPLV